VSWSAAPVNPLATDLEHILARTGGLWERLRGARIFVTGGTGFFGRWLLESFHHANQRLKLHAHLVVLSRDPEKFRAGARHLFEDGAIDMISGDVRSFTVKHLREQLPQSPAQFQYVIHAATEASAKLNADNPYLMIETILEGTRRVLEFARATGARRFLLTSSGAVYGKQPAEVTHVPEEFAGAPDCAAPESAYAEGKRGAESLAVCFSKQHRIDPLIARCFAFVGPFLPLDAHFAIGNFIRDALQGGPIRINGDGTAVRSYLYAGDLAIWLWTILLNGKPGRPYNVGSTQDLSIRDLAEAVRKTIDPSITIVIAEKAKAGAAVARYVPSTARATAELGLTEGIDLSEAIRRTAADHRSANKAS
jgi:nucleoside-diphosphate-sugar epimerase